MWILLDRLYRTPLYRRVDQAMAHLLDYEVRRLWHAHHG